MALQITDRLGRWLLTQVGPPDKGGCRMWLAGHDRNGYPRLKPYRGSKYQSLAVRVLWQRETGEESEGNIKHLCGNKWCVEITHMTCRGEAPVIVPFVADKTEPGQGTEKPRLRVYRRTRQEDEERLHQVNLNLWSKRFELVPSTKHLELLAERDEIHARLGIEPTEKANALAVNTGT